VEETSRLVGNVGEESRCLTLSHGEVPGAGELRVVSAGRRHETRIGVRRSDSGKERLKLRGRQQIAELTTRVRRSRSRTSTVQNRRAPGAAGCPPHSRVFHERTRSVAPTTCDGGRRKNESNAPRELFRRLHG